MTASRDERLPFPDGWFFIISRKTIEKAKITTAAQKRDMSEDAMIWGRKHYRLCPVLSRSDGEIGMSQRYCKQFYPEQLSQTGWDGLGLSPVNG